MSSLELTRVNRGVAGVDSTRRFDFPLDFPIFPQPSMNSGKVTKSQSGNRTKFCDPIIFTALAGTLLTQYKCHLVQGGGF